MSNLGVPRSHWDIRCIEGGRGWQNCEIQVPLQSTGHHKNSGLVETPFQAMAGSFVWGATHPYIVVSCRHREKFNEIGIIIELYSYFKY